MDKEWRDLMGMKDWSFKHKIQRSSRLMFIKIEGYVPGGGSGQIEGMAHRCVQGQI